MIPFRRLACLLPTIMICLSSVFAQEELPNDRHYIMTARPLPVARLNLSLGLDLTILPEPLTEGAIPAPMVDVRARLGLPLNLSGLFRAASNYATTMVEAGGMWSVPIGNLSVGAGYRAAFMYGYLNYLYGFNTTQTMWLNYPMVMASWDFGTFTLTGRLEAELITSRQQRIEGQFVDATKRIFNGGSLTVAIEQPFWKQTHIMLGVSLISSRNPYQAWFLYNTFDEVLFYPELFAGFLL